MFNPQSFRYPTTPFAPLPYTFTAEQEDVDDEILSAEPDDHDLAPYRAMAQGEW